MQFINAVVYLKYFFFCDLPLLQVQTTTMCISVSLSGSVVLGCLFAPKVHIILFQPQKNVCTLRVATTRFSVTTGPGSSFSQGNPGTTTPMRLWALINTYLWVIKNIFATFWGNSLIYWRNKSHTQFNNPQLNWIIKNKYHFFQLVWSVCVTQTAFSFLHVMFCSISLQHCSDSV